MNTIVHTKPPAIARILHIALMMVIVLLSIVVLVFAISSVMLLLPTGLQETMLQQIADSGAPVPSTGAMLASVIAGAVMALAYLYVALVVKAIVKTTFNGNPFVPENISRLRKTWVIVALAEIFRMIMTGFGLKPSADNFLEGFSIDTQLTAWFLVFVIAVMAEVFRHGLKLQQDQELTV